MSIGKQISIFLTLSLVFLLLVLGFKSKSVEPFYTQSQSSVRVFSYRREIDQFGTLVSSDIDAYCSGFVILPNAILTAKHCFTHVSFNPDNGHRSAIEPLYIQTKTGPPLKIKRVHYFGKHDFVLVYISSSKPLTPIKFSDTMFLGEKVYLYGLNGENPWIESTGILSGGLDNSFYPDDKERLIPFECASCYGGDSGGAVYDVEGNVVGMLTRGDFSHPVAYMIPAVDIEKELKGIL